MVTKEEWDRLDQKVKAYERHANKQRLLALAALIDCLRRDQMADGMSLFRLVPDDRISMNDAQMIVDALRAYA